MRNLRHLTLVGVSAVALATPALAQEKPATDGAAGAEEIVVTGTLIRGIAPGGSQTINLGQEKIASIGAVTTSDLVANLPQTTQFLGFVGVRGSSNFSLSVNRPALRYLGGGSASGAATLLLLDGHRLPGMGITQSSPDLDAISPGAIERVEVVTDGGSATYGSDAIGGVMNFVTRRKFDGAQVRGSVGFADDLMQYNAGVTLGKAGDTLSAYVTYDYASHDELYGRDRDWSRNLNWVDTTAAGREIGANFDCQPGNFRIAGTVYALPGVTPGLGNRCDLSEDTTFYPRETKHSVFGRVVFEPGGPASFDIAAYYVNRRAESDGGPLLIPGGVTIASTNPFLPAGVAAVLPTSGTYLFNLSPVLGNSSQQVTKMESYGITPTVKFDLGGGWQTNLMMNYGVGKSEFLGQQLNGSPIQSAITAGTFNPFNLSAPGNAAVLATATDNFAYGRATHQMMNARVVADGPLFELPAGAVRVGVGAEYYWEKYVGNNNRSLTAAGIAALADRAKSRSVKSFFGEVNVPIFGDGSGPFHSMSISAAGRYDDYSDFGSTFNPKLGATIEPVEWLKLRGNWGKSFQAPGISDIALGGAPSFSVLSLATRPFSDPNRPPPADGSRAIFLTLGGTITPLQPQKATTWTLGFDIKPPVLDGFSAGLTYYNIDFTGVISLPPIFTPTVYYRDFSDKNVVFTQGDAAMQTFYNQLAQGATNKADTDAQIAAAGGFSRIYGVLDARTQNLARIKTSGLDFYARYFQETGFGAVFGDFTGSYILNFQQQSSPTAVLVDTLALDTTRFRFVGSVGADVGNLRTQVTWNHSGGYAIIPNATNLQQNRIGSYNVFNLFMQYKVPGDSTLAKDLVLTLNVDNIFDKDPPLLRGAGSSLFGVANGFTLGRLFRLGLSKKF